MCRNTAAHLGRAENSTGKTQVTLALLQDPENPKKNMFYITSASINSK